MYVSDRTILYFLTLSFLSVLLQMSVDLLSTSATNDSVSNIVDVRLFNPETSAAVSVASLDNPYILRLPLEYNPNTTTYVANQSRIAVSKICSTIVLGVTGFRKYYFQLMQRNN